MKKKPLSRKALAEHRALIESIGRQRLMDFTGLSRTAIVHWIGRGIPRSWFASVSRLPRK